MRNCSFCGAPCDSSTGLSRELKTVYWGGSRNGNVEYAPKLVSFFCNEEHRNDFLVAGARGGEVQTKRVGWPEERLGF